MGRKQNRIVGAAEREAAIEQWRKGMGVLELARILGVHRNTINQWIRGKERERVADREVLLEPADQRMEELELQIAALEGTVGRQAMELRFFKGALRRVEVSRQRRSGSGDTASTPKSGA